MILIGDTQAERLLAVGCALGPQAVDVLISEMSSTPDVWVTKQSGHHRHVQSAYQVGMVNAEAVQVNSHTPQRAFG